jgi:four helix bundle suffix protein
LQGFQVATLVYDATVSFCERFVEKLSRTRDQIVQAARSGRQNIAEGSRASAASSQTELRLVNVARASLDELLLDYEDFLRQRKLRQWAKNDPEALEVRAVGRGRGKGDRTDQSDLTDRTDRDPRPSAASYQRWLQHRDPSVVANAIICLIHQANYLLDRQSAGLERGFIEKGGYTESLAAARLAARREQQKEAAQSRPPKPDQKRDLNDPSDLTDRSDPPELPSPPSPACPLCGEPMQLRTARRGPRTGGQFWGCSEYPTCRGTRRVEGDAT